jgi:hypothetical protein
MFIIALLYCIHIYSYSIFSWLLTEKVQPPFLTSGRKLGNSAVFEWTATGEVFNNFAASNWCPRQPSGDGDFVEVLNWTWNDLGIQHLRAFVCEYSVS